MSDPTVSPDLAQKALSAEKRNAIVGLQDGGTLPSAIRKDLQISALTPALAEQQRAAAFLAEYCAGGELTAAQWELVCRVHPGFSGAPSPVRPLAAAPAAAGVVPVEASQAGSDAGGLVLTAPPARTVKLTKSEATSYAKLYKGKESSWRVIYTWLEIGEQKSFPCPLAHPEDMPVWWDRCMKWRVPAEIEQAAIAARQKLAAAPAPAAPLQDLGGAPQALPPPPIPPAGGEQRRKIDLEKFDPAEGARLRGLLQLEAAKLDELTQALAGGDADSGKLTTEYVKLTDTVDKIESRLTERMQRRGLLVDRDEVERDLAATAELFRQSRESMKRRVLERCASLTAEQRIEVGTAIERACDSEAKTFAKLNVLTTDDLLREFAA